MHKEDTHLTKQKVYYVSVKVKVPVAKNKRHTAAFVTKTISMPTRSENVREMRDSEVDLAYVRKVVGGNEFEIESLTIIKKL